MSRSPLISIIIPTFNSQRYLNECLLSIKSQTEEDYEVIFVDNASTDKTIEIILSYEFKHSSILQQTSTTLPGALHEGFCAAKGSILCWLNSDDMYARQDVLNMVKRAFTQEALPHSFLYGNVLLVNSNGIIINLLSSHWKINKFQRAIGHTNLCTGAMFFSRDLYSRFGGFDQKYHVGFEYPLIDYLFANGRSIFVGMFMQAYRIHDKQLSKVSEFKMNVETRAIDSNFPKVKLISRVHWIIYRLISRTLFSNPLQRNKWKGKYISEYWACYANKNRHD